MNTQIETLVNQCKKLTDPNLSVDDLYINLKYLRETIEVLEEEKKDIVTVSISGAIGVGKTSLSYIIGRALENADISYENKEYEYTIRQIPREDIENRDLSNMHVIIKEGNYD